MKEIYQIFEISRTPGEFFSAVKEEFGQFQIELAMGAHLIGKISFYKFPSELAIKLNTLPSKHVIVADEFIDQFMNMIENLPRRKNKKGKGSEKILTVKGLESTTLQSQSYVPLLFIVKT